MIFWHFKVKLRMVLQNDLRRAKRLWQDSNQQPYTLQVAVPAQWAILSVEYCHVQLLYKKVSCFSCGKRCQIQPKLKQL